MARGSWRSLLPHEHGAYGQVAFPLIAAFASSGVSPDATLVALAAVAGFLAHEPALILMGRRGPRAHRERGHAARAWLAWCLAGIGAAAVALGIRQPAAMWSLIVPFVPAVALIAAIALGRDKSWYGEIAAALAFAGTAVPICLFAGAPVRAAAAVAIPFALLFVSATLSVHVVILHGRGREIAAMRRTRAIAVAVSVIAVAALAAAVLASLLTAGVLVAALPGLVTAAAVAIQPPAPTRLRDLGWLLIGVSVLTTAVVVLVARRAL